MLGVDVDNLGKRYGDLDAVRGVSFAIRPGEVFGLLGPNGAGKTTTISMLSTLLRPSYGDAHVFGKSVVSEVRSVRRLVGIAPQDISLYPNLSAVENLDFFGRIYGVPSARLRTRAAELLDLVGLTARADERVDTYSGGMKRRLNLACGLVHEPRLLLLDEPTVGVDPQSRDHILGAVRRIAEGGMTVLYTTHYMEEAERFCDRIAIMDEGRIVAAGTLAELLQIVGMGEVIEIEGAPVAGEATRLGAIPGVTHVETTPHSTRLVVADSSRALAPVAAIVAERPGGVEGLNLHRVNLEQVFLQMTGKELRD
jgi:ABC-2 type transport system ATP-binding protein